MRQQRSLSRAVLCAIVVLFSVLSYATADSPDCGDTQCHVLAWCEFNSTNHSVCACQPGTIDKSGGAGLDCDPNGYSIRYVVETNPIPTENPTADVSREDAMAMCVSAEGYFLRRIMGSTGIALEVNCIYSTRPDNTSAYGETQSPGGITYDVKPAIYVWWLPTTSKPLRIPPTGMEVLSVQFKSDCAETGCWVIKGTVTTGEAYNENGAFNTFFLPQANISGLHPQGDISYDYNYGAVEWTFSPANHPCTSAAYEAGAAGSNTDKISTCCISNPTGGSTGGFVANYRPTQAFVDWSGELTCDVVFDRAGQKKCWKLFKELNTWAGANDRCAAAGGHLALVLDSDEEAQMHDFLNSVEPTEGTVIGDPALYRAAFVYIGLRRYTAGSGNFSWVDGTSYDYDLGFAYPNNANDCVHKIGKGDYSTTSCGRENAFMCEFDPPTFDETCIKHVIQRPKYSSPNPNRPCWDVQTWQESDGWFNAKEHCEAKGGYLPVIEDAEENWFFRRLLDWKGHWDAWLGVTKNTTTDEWSYPDGVARPSFYHNPSDIDRTPWRTGGYPTDLPWCVLVAPGGRWYNGDCERRRSVVCEFDRETHPDKTCMSDQLEDLHPNWDLIFPNNAQSFIDVGKFKGMPASPGIVALDNLDPFFGQYSFEIQLDEVELRSEAGKLRGTVGVEHTVDTYLGLANFRTTGLEVLDTFTTQVNIHLEKTNFFTVSTHGVNDFTFLEYVNMRLVMVLNEDADFSGSPVDGMGNGDSEAGNRTVRTSREADAAYVQVTFTMGSQYQPNLPAGLIPLDSVRVGLGTFFDDADAAGDMKHVCSQYDDAADEDSIGLTGLTLTTPNSYLGLKSDFKARVGQPGCGPQAAMCVSPESTPDSFVSFNIPLGFDVFDGKAASDLSSNVFVDFVVNAIDTDPSTGGSAGPTPNEGDDPMQMKTTLSGSIPIVTGGINIFCDGITAKTDLKDVANVDIVVGTASDSAELTRLRIMEDIASTDLSSVDSQRIDTDSIESALMTLVIKGNHSYFGGAGRNTLRYTVELDDLITIHLMEDGDAGSVTDGVSTNSKENKVLELLAIPGDDNSDSNGLDTDGYYLNGAFYFTVVRNAGLGEPRAMLEPSPALLAECPFNPPRPAAGSSPLESCIVRRDVKERGYPNRQGAPTTAMELLAAETDYLGTEAEVDGLAAALLPGNTTGNDAGSDEALFLTNILGDSVFTRQLAVDFVRTIHEKYQLNGRYRRAYWINPGYEWTPTQTAGRSVFSVSQKIYLFALVSMDENWGRRRMLLQTATDTLENNDGGMNAAAVEFAVSPKSMLANAFTVPQDRVQAFEVELQLTAEEACMEPHELQASLRTALVGYLETTATTFHTVQVLSLDVDRGDEQCGARRNVRKLLASYSSASATVQMLIVFHEGTISKFDLEKFSAMERVKAVQADPNNSPKLEIGALDCDTEECGKVEAASDDDKSSSSNTALIAGIAGGVGGGVLALGAGLFLWSRKRSEPEAVPSVQTIDVASLKAQLTEEV